MKNTTEGIAINNRFFEAIELLKSLKAIRGHGTITREMGLNRNALTRVKYNPSTSIIKPEWIHYLCKTYNVSAEWVILGVGSIINSKKIV